MTNQTLEEMEFSILINGTDRHMAEVFTDDTIWVDRLKRKGFKPYKVTGASHFYKIPVKKIMALRSAEDRILTESQIEARRAAGARLRRA